MDAREVGDKQITESNWAHVFPINSSHVLATEYQGIWTADLTRKSIFMLRMRTEVSSRLGRLRITFRNLISKQIVLPFFFLAHHL